jgi:hypothetical protein
LISEELGQIEYQGEQVYRTLTQNTFASRMIIDQLTPFLPKDTEEVNAQVKRLQPMLDTTIMVELTLEHLQATYPLASRMIVDQLTPLQPKNSEDVNA